MNKNKRWGEEKERKARKWSNSSSQEGNVDERLCGWKVRILKGEWELHKHTGVYNSDTLILYIESKYYNNRNAGKNLYLIADMTLKQACNFRQTTWSFY